MAFNLPPPPLPDKDSSSFAWKDWFRQVRSALMDAGAILWSRLDFTGSKIKDILDRKHKDLQNIQGGTTDEYYHLTSTEYTGTGTGVFARKTSPILVTPNIGVATGTSLSVTTTIKSGGYTVATLPAGTIGMRSYVTDALAPTFLGILVGGGAIVTPCFYNGTNWIAE